MQEFWIRVASTWMVILILLGYNITLDARSKEEEIARLNVMVAGTQSETEEAVAGYKDGNYTGEAEGFGGRISVEVTVESGQITGINMLSAEGEDGAYLSMAEEVITDILDAQSTEVDSVSGATFSSNGIKEAVKQALDKAVE